MPLKHVEMVLYYRPLCPYCRLLKELVLDDILRDRTIAEKISYYEVDLSSPVVFWNPYKFISEEEKIHVIDITGKRSEVISGKDISEYAHLHVATPILELRVYSDGRMDKFIFVGFLSPRMRDFKNRVLNFKVNLYGLLKSLARNL